MKEGKFMKEKLELYNYNDKILFRKCSLFSKPSLKFGDCTAFYQEADEQFKKYFYCSQLGIHLHCTKHPNVEYEEINNPLGITYLKCPICKEAIYIEDKNALIKNCLKKSNMEKFKNAKIIRVDEYYAKEIKKKITDKRATNYWIEADVKTDKDGDTMVVLYVGKRNSKDKCQFFIKPEKLQLSTDYKDLDPAEILAKIEVTLKDRVIKQEYDK